MTSACVVLFFGVIFVVPRLTSAPESRPGKREDSPHLQVARPSPSGGKPTQPAADAVDSGGERPSTVGRVPESESHKQGDAVSSSAAVQPPDERDVLPAASPNEPGASLATIPKSIRMFPPFTEGRIKWQPFDLPVVAATDQNIKAYRLRMAEFYGEFDRANGCRTEQQRIEQAGRFIISCDATIGFDGVEVPDSYVEWTELFVKVIQIRAESMYYPWGVPETEFRTKHKESEIHAQANALLEDLTKRSRIR
jgi:hypothetical protein